MEYLLDTNICIYLIKKSSKSLMKKIKAHDYGDLGISSLSFAELEYGVQKSQKKNQNKLALMQFLAPLEIIDFDSHAAMEYGQIRADLERKGKIIAALDMLIAAQARSKALTLVTNNEREFKRVSQLKVENWV